MLFLYILFLNGSVLSLLVFIYCLIDNAIVYSYFQAYDCAFKFVNNLKKLDKSSITI